MPGTFSIDNELDFLTSELAALAGPFVAVFVDTSAAFYSAGTLFYRNRAGWRHAHGTWHLFVIGGSASHYLGILHCLTGR